MAFQQLGRQVMPDKEAGVEAGCLAEGFTVEAADRWPAERAAGSVDLGAALEKKLSQRPALVSIYRTIERPLTPVLARMEPAGVAIDVPYLAAISARMEKELRALEEKIWAEAEKNSTSTLRSSSDRSRSRSSSIQSSRRPPRRSLSTGVEVLTELAEKGYSASAACSRVSGDREAQGNVRRCLARPGRPRRTRPHLCFVRRSRRPKDSPPPIPTFKHPDSEPRRPEIRRAFIAPAGRQLIVADYSQIELGSSRTCQATKR
jgi:DNA polymerase-1